jgi:hypothetical protein
MFIERPKSNFEQNLERKIKLILCSMRIFDWSDRFLDKHRKAYESTPELLLWAEKKRYGITIQKIEII